jgi:2-(1,2-epoxy-1,2-dihydrophenyl)acetyl-CoA isomerase
MQPYSTIKVDSSDGLATVVMNRPDRLNGMTHLMLFETYDALLELSADPSIRVLVLTGAGRGFCPGADLQVMAGGDPGPEHEAAWFRVPVLLHEMAAVTIAAVNGACAGAGLGWAAACDLRLAARTAKFNTAFLNVAVAGDMGLPWSLPRLVGAGRARDLSFCPRKFDAAEALQIGLVSEVYEETEFRAGVQERVAQLMAAAPQALRAMKQHYLEAERSSFSDYSDLETAHHLTLLKAADPRGAFEALRSSAASSARPSSLSRG